MPFPLSIEEISREWVAGLLESNGHSSRGLERVVSEPIGTGQIGDSVRITLDWSDAAEAPTPLRSLVVKFASSDPTSRSTGASTGLYRREVRFYAEIAPRTNARLATCLFGQISDDERFALVLEDLAPGQVGDQLAGCTVSAAERAVEVAASIHASWWNDPELEDFRSWLSVAGDPARSSGLGQLWPIAWAEFQRRHVGSLDDAQVELAEKFGHRIEAFAARPRGPFTVIHGDYRLDNMLFGPESSWMVPVDWQTVAIGPGVGDIAYFLGASLLPEDRRRSELALVRQWYDGVVGLGVAGYSWDECWAGYQLATFDGFVTAVGATVMAKQTDRGDRMFLAMADRHLRTALDHGGIELLDRW